MPPFSWLPAKRNFPGACTAKPSSRGARQSDISLPSSNKENLFISVQCEHSNSSSGFVLFTLGMKWAPNTGTLVECYGDSVSREGHFSEDTEGRATPKCYQVTHVWFSNLIRPFEIPVVLWHRLCVLGLAVLGKPLIRDSRKEAAKISWLSPTAMQMGEVTQKAEFWMVWRPEDSVAAAGSTETAKARWSRPPEHPSCDQQKAKSCSASILAGRWGKAFWNDFPGGNCVIAVCWCLVGKGIALLGMCEVQGHALLGYKSQRLQPPTSHFGRGA